MVESTIFYASVEFLNEHKEIEAQCHSIEPFVYKCTYIDIARSRLLRSFLAPFIFKHSSSKPTVKLYISLEGSLCPNLKIS